MLDLSWNAIGSLRERTHLFSDTLSRILQTESCSLIHLDISHNNLPVDICKKIAQGLSENTWLIGFHVKGNAAYIDSYGFMVCIPEDEVPIEELMKKMEETKSPRAKKVQGASSKSAMITPRTKSSSLTPSMAGKGKGKENTLSPSSKITPKSNQLRIPDSKKSNVKALCPPVFKSKDGGLKFYEEGDIDNIGGSLALMQLDKRMHGKKMILNDTDEFNFRMKAQHNCWICEGWSKKSFEYQLDIGMLFSVIYSCR